MAVKFMIIYVDILLAVNFVITYLTLVSSAVISGLTYSRKRIIISSAAGALFCLYIFFPNENYIINISVKLLSLTVCVLIAFYNHNRKNFIIQSVVFVFLNTAVGGLSLALSFKSSIVYEENTFFYFNINPVLLIFSSCIIYIFIMIFQCIKEKITPASTHFIDIKFKDFSILKIPSFYDTGFKVKDIVSNKDVLLLSLDRVKNSIPKNILNEIEKFFVQQYSCNSVKITPVFFNTISGEGVLPAIKTEYIILDGKKISNVLVAFTKNQLSENVYAVFGYDIKKQL